MSIFDKLRARGIEVHRYGRSRILCPECSAGRKKENRKKPILVVDVSSTEAKYFCHNDQCDFKGIVTDGECESESFPKRRPRTYGSPILTEPRDRSGSRFAHGRRQRKNLVPYW